MKTSLKLKGMLLRTLIIVSLIFSSYSPEIFATSDCHDVLVVFARGSSQLQYSEDDQPQTYRFFNEIKSRAPAGADVQVEELVYPAVGGWNHYVEAEWSWARIGDYRSSVEEGVNNAYNLLNQETADCPDQKIILGGYSQGAQVMGDVLYRLSDEVADKITYVGLFGDPKFKADSFAARGDFERRGGGILEPRAEDFPVKFRGKTYSWCKKFDGICENNLLLELIDGSDHPSYQYHEIPAAANEAAVLLNDLGFTTEVIDATEELSALDVVLVFDASSPSTLAVNSIKTHHTEIINYTQSLSQDTLIGIVDFNHPMNNDPQDVRTLQTLTDDKALLQQRIAQVRAHESFDTSTSQQNVYSGLNEALANQPWRQEAVKAIIYVTRLTPYNPEPETGFTTEGITYAARTHDTGPITINPLFTHDRSPLAISRHRAVSDATGGRTTYFSESDRSNAYLHLQTALAKLKLDPLPLVLGPYGWRPQVPMILSVGKIYDPDGSISSYEWDFDNDGIYDEETKNSVAVHTYETNYHGAVGVRVAYSNGQETPAYTYVKILVDVDENNLILQRPSQPREVSTNYLAASNGAGSALKTLAAVGFDSSAVTTKVKLSWQSPENDGGSVVEGYAVYGNGQLLGVRPADQLEAVINNVPLDAQFTVAAVNAAGYGPTAGVEAVPVEGPPPTPDTTETEEPVEVTEQTESAIDNEAPPIAYGQDVLPLTSPTSVATRPSGPLSPTVLGVGEDIAAGLIRLNWWLLVVAVMLAGSYVYYRYRYKKYFASASEALEPQPTNELLN